MKSVKKMLMALGIMLTGVFLIHFLPVIAILVFIAGLIFLLIACFLEPD